MAEALKAKPRPPRNRTGDNLRARGFDETYYVRETQSYRVRCSQCETMVINGVACHETGCPNAKRDD